MTPAEAEIARRKGIERTTQEWIKLTEEVWKGALSKGRDYAIISSLNGEVPEVQQKVVEHFRNLGYHFQEEKYFGGEYEDYILRLAPPPDEPGTLAQLLTRLFGGQHA